MSDLESEIAALVREDVFAQRVPLAPGHYWGRWHTPAPGTDDNGEGCSGDEWEVHQVFENCLDVNDPEYLMVFVPGVSVSQPLSAFEWGKRVVR